jgi:ABC-2 type transport system ATP-binding protein
MSTRALHFRQVDKRYGATLALAGVELEVEAGELFGLVGVNGAGKTSLIKCLFDFVALDGGSIEIFGRSHRQPAARQPLAFLPERFNPPYYLTGAEFLAYLLRLQGLAYQPQAVAAMLDALDLDQSALRRAVRDYSKGMTQKLGLAACLLARKDVLVLDEPMSGLDPKARALLKAQLQLVRARGGSVFFSSHALTDVEEICDRMAILHQGQVRYVGTPAGCRSTFGAASLEQAFLACVA